MSFKGKKHTPEWKKRMGERTRIRMAKPEVKEHYREIFRRPRIWSSGPHPSMARPGNKHVLGKRWKLTRARRQQIGENNRRLWREEIVPFPGAGIGRSGYREDLDHFVRSRWEANLCRIFLLLGIEYRYEAFTFKLGQLGSYRPDFFLPHRNLFIELKGYDSELAAAKRKASVREYGIRLAVITGTGYRRMESRFKDRIPKWE